MGLMQSQHDHCRDTFIRRDGEEIHLHCKNADWGGDQASWHFELAPGGESAVLSKV